MMGKEILAQLEANQAKKARIGIHDIDGVLRGKIIHINKLKKALADGFGFCNVVFGWDINDTPYTDTKVSGWGSGYPDAHASLDFTSYRKIPWENGTPFFLGDFSQDTSGIRDFCPRSLLKKVRERCRDQGFAAIFSGELEWYNFQESPSSFADKKHRDPKPITPGMFGYSVLRLANQRQFIEDLFDQLHEFDIPIEGLHTETGDGVLEACIEYDEVLEAADRMALFKTSVKEIACHRGQLASFMAKWNKDLPGCSGHIHQSLWDEEKSQNLFYDPERQYGMSLLMEQYLAGQLYCLPYILPMYAPSVNSYKRLVPGSWASVSASWGLDNRTTALRVIQDGSNGTRIETRVPGADANPYLSMAASLASGLYGIQQGLSLGDLPPTLGNEYENKTNPRLARSLKEATDLMKESEIPAQLFGESFVQHFVATREWEWSQFLGQVTDWEMKRYFEII